MEAGKKRLTGDIVQQANSSEVVDDSAAVNDTERWKWQCQCEQT